jgi:subtilisin family serine protease
LSLIHSFIHTFTIKRAKLLNYYMWTALGLSCVSSEQTTSSLSGNPLNTTCGFTIGTPNTDISPIDPCGPDAVLLHGPVLLEPNPGIPAIDTANLNVSEPGFLCIQASADRIASAVANLGNVSVFQQNDFNINVQTLNKILPIQPPGATLTWDVRSTPSGSLTYQVLFAADTATPRGQVNGAAGLISVFNLHDGLDPFSPADLNGVRDFASFSVVSEVSPFGISLNSAGTHSVRTVFEIASSDSCGQIATITVDSPITQSTPTNGAGNFQINVLASWDGKDTFGAFVPDGGYFYRASISLIKTNPGGQTTIRDFVNSEILTIEVDNTPPVILVENPDTLLSSTKDSLQELDGKVIDNNLNNQLFVSITSPSGNQSLSVPIVSEEFHSQIILNEGVDPLKEDNIITLSASDLAGNVTTRARQISLFREFILDEIGIIFKDNISDAIINSAISSFGGSIVSVNENLNLYWIKIPFLETVETSLLHFRNLIGLTGIVKTVGRNYIYLTNQVIPNDLVTRNFGSHTSSAFEDIDIFNAYSVTTGSKDIVVAVIDTGIDLVHPDFQGLGDPCLGNLFVNVAEDTSGGIRVGNCILDENDNDGIDDDSNGFVDDVIGFDFGDFLNNTPVDANGHGTAVSGIIGAIGNNEYGAAGVNWNVSILPVRASIQNFGAFDTKAITAAIDYISQPSFEVDILNLSLGGKSTEGDPDEFLALSLAQANDILIVASAGNAGQDNDDFRAEFPASFDLPNIISVAATARDSFELAEFRRGGSNFGLTTVDLAAPGAAKDGVFDLPSFTTTYPFGRSVTELDCLRLPTSNCNERNGPLGSFDGNDDFNIEDVNDFGDFSGTSASAPLVAGTAALVKSINPSFTSAQIKSILFACVDKDPALEGKMVTGGRLNAACSVNLAISTTIPPSIILAGTEPESTFNNQRVTDIAFDPLDPEGDFWIGSSADNKSHVFTTIPIFTGANSPNLEISNGVVNFNAVEFSPDGQMIAIVGNNSGKELQVYDKAGLLDNVLDPQDLVYTHDTNGNSLSLSWTSDSKFLAVGNTDGKIFIFRKDSLFGNNNSPLIEENIIGNITDLSFSANGEILAVANRDNLLLYNTSNLPSLPSSLPPPEELDQDNDVNSVEFNPVDTSTTPILAFNIGALARTCSVTSLGLIACFVANETDDKIKEFSWSPNGRLLAFGDNSGHFFIIDTAINLSPLIFESFSENTQEIRALEFNNVGSFLGVGSRNKFFGDFSNVSFFSINPPQGI